MHSGYCRMPRPRFLDESMTPAASRPARRIVTAAAFAAAFLLLSAANARARDELCDPSFTDCRAPLLALINAETSEIDVGMWFMEDARYASALINRLQAGVKVRIIFDTRSDEAGHAVNQQIVDQLATGGVPMRLRVKANSIEH